MFCFIYFFSLCLDDRLKKYAQERKDLLDEVSKLKFELEEERIRSSGQCYNLMNGSDNEDFEDSSLYFKNLSLKNLIVPELICRFFRRDVSTSR